jgi:hypothetical protein
MTEPDLDDLVRLARRDRPTSATLAAIARGLKLPFAALSLGAAVAPGNAIAGALAKQSAGRLGLMGWGAGSAVVITGAVAAMTLAAPTEPPLLEAPAPAKRVVSAELGDPKPQPSPAVSPSSAAPLGTAAAEPPKASDAPLRWDEPQLIERARRALGTDAQRALALTQEHQRRFPNGELRVEREVIALEALARSGRASEARKRALVFEAKHPKSIYLPQVRALLARLGASDGR